MQSSSLVMGRSIHPFSHLILTLTNSTQLQIDHLDMERKSGNALFPPQNETGPASDRHGTYHPGMFVCRLNLRLDPKCSWSNDLDQPARPRTCA